MSNICCIALFCVEFRAKSFLSFVKKPPPEHLTVGQNIAKKANLRALHCAKKLFSLLDYYYLGFLYQVAV